VNAFVNAGFGNDKLMVTAEEGSSWIYKNKDHGAWFGSIVNKWLLIHLKGMMSTVASLGLSLLWDTEVGLSHIDKYTYSAEEHKVGVSFQMRSAVKFLIYARLDRSWEPAASWKSSTNGDHQNQ